MLIPTSYFIFPLRPPLSSLVIMSVFSAHTFRLFLVFSALEVDRFVRLLG